MKVLRKRLARIFTFTSLVLNDTQMINSTDQIFIRFLRSAVVKHMESKRPFCLSSYLLFVPDLIQKCLCAVC